jgi:hypothetical protein
MSGNVTSATGWSSRRGVIFPLAAVSLPVTRFSYVANATGAADGAYQINGTELVTVQFPATMFTSKQYASNAATFVVVPSPGTVTASATTIPQQQLTSNADATWSLRLTLSDNERWSSSAPAVVAGAAFGSDASPLAFNTFRARLLLASNINVDGQNLRIRFNATPAYTIFQAENITFVIPASATASNLAPTNPQIILRVTPAPAIVVAVNSTVIGEDMLSGAQRAVKLTVRVSNGAFVTSVPALATCAALMARNATVLSTNKLEERFLNGKIRRQLFTRVSVSSSNPTLMFIHLLEMDSRNGFVFDVSTPLNLNIAIPAVCLQSGVVPAPPWVRFRVVPVPPQISVVPSTISEADIRARTVTVRLTVSAWGQWRPQAVQLLTAALTVTGTSTSYGVSSRLATIKPTLRAINSRIVELRLERDSWYDINRVEVIDFSSVDLRQCLNASGLPWPSSSALKLNINPVAGQLRLLTATSGLTQLNLRSLNTKLLPRNLTFRLEYGERFLGTPSSFDEIRNYIAVTPAASRDVFLGLLAPTPRWHMSAAVAPRPQLLVVPLDYSNAAAFAVPQNLRIVFQLPIGCGSKRHCGQLVACRVHPAREPCERDPS